MEESQRDNVLHNLSGLLEMTFCDAGFLGLFVSARVLGSGDMDHILACQTKAERNMEFYKILLTRTNSYQVLLNALDHTNQSGALQLLSPGIFDYSMSPRPSAPMLTPSAPLMTPSAPLMTPFPVPASTPQTCTFQFSHLVPSSSPYQDFRYPYQGNQGSSVIESVLTLQMPPKRSQVRSVVAPDFRDGMTPLKVSVTRPKSRMCFEDDHYKLPPDFKGYALVLNIIQFKNEHRDRSGARHDTTYQSELWTQLGYKVTTREGHFSLIDVKALLANFKEQFDNAPSENISCVIFIGSHGTFSKIESSDHEEINLYHDIIYQFDSLSCPKLQGRPKMFFIQACQRFETDDPATITKTICHEREECSEMPIDDTVVCFSTIPGCVSHRDIYMGTWYTYCLTQVIMENAHRMDLFRMLVEVQERMRHIISDATTSQGQLPAFMHFGIRTLYFNLE